MAKSKTTKKAPASKTGTAKAAKAKESPKSKPAPSRPAKDSEPVRAPKPAAAPSGAGKAAASQPGEGRRFDPGFSPRAHEEAQLTKTQISELFQKLVDERARVLRGLDKHLGEAVTDIDPLADEVDVATRHSEQAYLIRFADKERKLLREIDHALEKMRVGEYGLCEGTDEAIGYPRLALRPWTRYSVRYKEELEREKRQRQF